MTHGTSWLPPQLGTTSGAVGERLHFEDLLGVLGWAACHLAIFGCVMLVEWLFNGCLMVVSGED